MLGLVSCERCLCRQVYRVNPRGESERRDNEEIAILLADQWPRWKMQRLEINLYTYYACNRSSCCRASSFAFDLRDVFNPRMADHKLFENYFSVEKSSTPRSLHQWVWVIIQSASNG